MKELKVPITAAFAGLVGALLALAITGRETNTHSDTREIESQAEVLQTQDAEIDPTFEDEVERDAGVTPDLPERHAMSPLGSDEEHAAELEALRQRGDLLDSLIAAEVTDSTWVREVDAALESLRENIPSRTLSFGDVRCGSTLCRIDAEVFNVEGRTILNRTMGRASPFDTSGTVIPTTIDAMGDVRIYISRGGGLIPR